MNEPGHPGVDVVLVLQGLDGQRKCGRRRGRAEGRGQHVGDVADEAEGKFADEDDWNKSSIVTSMFYHFKRVLIHNFFVIYDLVFRYLNFPWIDLDLFNQLKIMFDSFKLLNENYQIYSNVKCSLKPKNMVGSINPNLICPPVR